MAFLKASAQTIGSNPRILQSSLYPNVPQQRSDNFQARSVFVQMCRECPAKGMRRNMFYPCPRAYVRNNLLKRHLRKRLTSFRQRKIQSRHQSLVFLFGFFVSQTGCRAEYLAFLHSFEVLLSTTLPFRSPFPVMR